MITNSQTNASVVEIADGLDRIRAPVPPNPALPGGFTFDPFLVVDERPLLFL